MDFAGARSILRLRAGDAICFLHPTVRQFRLFVTAVTAPGPHRRNSQQRSCRGDGPMVTSNDRNANPRPDRCTDCRNDCLCEELKRRQAYDAVRARKGLVALYRPPSMR